MSRAFLCADPAALASFRAGNQAVSTYVKDITAAAQALGSPGAYARYLNDGSWVTIGLQRCDPAPAGWRWTPSRKAMRPITGGDGEPARAWLKRWPGASSGVSRLTRRHGLAETCSSPTDATGSGYWGWPRVAVVDADGRKALVARYEWDRVDRMGDSWTEIKLSTYEELIEEIAAEASA